MSDEQRIKNLIKGWYENRAKRELDPTFKFLCVWICFNAWIDHKSQKIFDRDIIDWLKMQTKENSDLVREYENAKKTEPFINLLKSLTQETHKSPISKRNGSVYIDNENDFKNIIEAIYAVRCNLFHGNKEENNSRDQKLIRICQQILEKWIGNIVKSWKNERLIKP